jgi:glucokinase
MIIRRDGEKCNCGNNGCLETYCSKKKLKEKLCKLLKLKDYVSAADIIEQVKINSNKEIDSLINNYVENLALGIGNLINIFEPEVICIGGSIVHYEELIIERLRRKIEVGAYQFNKKDPPKILVARTGNDAGIIGATLLG